jgi:hypothetical protein
MRNALGRALPTITAAACIAFGATSAEAQKPGATTCMTLLTADELSKAVVAGFNDMGGRERGPGETECPWMLRGGADGFKTVAVQFYDLSKIKSDSTTPDKLFDDLLTGAEGMASGKKREMLAGIGQKAAFLNADPQVLAVVQRADGVARIVGNNLTRGQMTAVARAVASP